MPEIIVPCPSCQASLLVDEQNAGHEVLCPGCGVRLTLPTDVSGKSTVTATPVAEAPARRNHPLYRTGHLGPLPEDPEAAPVPAQNRPAHLPSRRGISAEEEMRRLAALTTDPGSFDLHNVDTKGRAAFPCPGCNRPVWITRSDWGRVLVCAGCTREVIAPDPSKGTPASLVQDEPQPEQRQKTVLPGRRQLENLPLGEQNAAGRPKRQGGQLPAARTPAPEPPPLVEDRRQTRVAAIEPIPARGDVEITTTLRKGPPAKRTVIPAEQAAAAAEFGDDNPIPLAPSGEMTKPLQRLSPERVPNFTPKHETDHSAEVAGNWGGVSADSNSVAFRRTLTLAILVLGLGAVLVTAFMLRSHFSPPNQITVNPAAVESPTKNVDTAKGTLERFFKATTVEQMAKEVRHPEKTLPRMKSFYARTGPPHLEFEFTDYWVEQDNWQNSGVDFIFTNLAIDGTKAASLEVPKDGSPPKLDWESFVAWSEMPWSEFLKTTSERPAAFRVTITPTDYYNGAFNDRTRYHAFLVKDAGNFGSCYAYCAVNSDLSLKILENVREARKKGLVTIPAGSDVEQGVARVILRLHFIPEGKKFNQATIDDLIWNDWLEP
jgi:hypothetical protein